VFLAVGRIRQTKQALQDGREARTRCSGYRWSKVHAHPVDKTTVGHSLHLIIPMRNKTVKRVNQLLANIDLVISKINRFSESLSKEDNTFDDLLHLDNATWGLMYSRSSLNSIFADKEIREFDWIKNEEAQSHQEEKPQTRGSSRLGRSNALNKSNNRIRRKSKGV
jgi:hypothetical protein